MDGPFPAVLDGGDEPFTRILDYDLAVRDTRVTIRNREVSVPRDDVGPFSRVLQLLTPAIREG